MNSKKLNDSMIGSVFTITTINNKQRIGRLVGFGKKEGLTLEIFNQVLDHYETRIVPYSEVLECHQTTPILTPPRSQHLSPRQPQTSSRQPQTEIACPSLVIKNIPTYFDKEDLTEVFNDYGTITDCKVDYLASGQSIGFIRYSRTKESTKAIANCHDQQLDSWIISVEYGSLEDYEAIPKKLRASEEYKRKLRSCRKIEDDNLNEFLAPLLEPPLAPLLEPLSISKPISKPPPPLKASIPYSIFLPPPVKSSATRIANQIKEKFISVGVPEKLTVSWFDFGGVVKNKDNTGPEVTMQLLNNKCLSKGNPTLQTQKPKKAKGISVSEKDYSAFTQYGYHCGHLMAKGNLTYDNILFEKMNTFLVTVLQDMQMNLGPFKVTEESSRLIQTKYLDVMIICGVKGTLQVGRQEDHIKSKLRVPEWIYAIVGAREAKSDIFKCDCFLFPNRNCSLPAQTYRVPLSRITELTGYNFFANVLVHPFDLVGEVHQIINYQYLASVNIRDMDLHCLNLTSNFQKEKSELLDQMKIISDSGEQAAKSSEQYLLSNQELLEEMDKLNIMMVEGSIRNKEIIAELMEENKELMEEKKELMEEANRLTIEKSELQTEVGSLDDKLNEFGNNNTSISNKLLIVEKDKQELIKQVDELKSGQSQLIKQVDELKSSQSQLQNELEKSEHQLISLQAQGCAKNKKIMSLTNQLEALRLLMEEQTLEHEDKIRNKDEKLQQVCFDLQLVTEDMETRRATEETLSAEKVEYLVAVEKAIYISPNDLERMKKVQDNVGRRVEEEVNKNNDKWVSVLDETGVSPRKRPKLRNERDPQMPYLSAETD